MWFHLSQSFFPAFLLMDEKRIRAGHDFKGACGVGSCARHIRGNRIGCVPVHLSQKSHPLSQGSKSLVDGARCSQTELLTRVSPTCFTGSKMQSMLTQKQFSSRKACLEKLIVSGCKGASTPTVWVTSWPQTRSLSLEQGTEAAGSGSHVPGCSLPAASQQVRAHPFNHHSGLHSLCFSWLGAF